MTRYYIEESSWQSGTSLTPTKIKRETPTQIVTSCGRRFRRDGREVGAGRGTGVAPATRSLVEGSAYDERYAEQQRRRRAERTLVDVADRMRRLNRSTLTLDRLEALAECARRIGEIIGGDS